MPGQPTSAKVARQGGTVKAMDGKMFPSWMKSEIPTRGETCAEAQFALTFFLKCGTIGDGRDRVERFVICR